MRRVAIPELLDSDGGTAEEIEQSLADLRRVNRWFGGIHTTRKLLREVIRQTGRRQLSLLEVAAGSGDIPLSLARSVEASRVSLQVTLLDRSRAHMDHQLRAVAADARTLPFSDGSFDLVCCALFAHHLEPGELLDFAHEGLRVCRIALLINDLRRSLVHLGLVYAGMPLFRSRLTRHDSVASVRRAYTPAELRAILSQTGARIEFHSSYLFRMGILLWRGGTCTI